MPVLPELQKWVRLFFQRAGPKRTRMVDIGREKERRLVNMRLWGEMRGF